MPDAEPDVEVVEDEEAEPPQKPKSKKSATTDEAEEKPRKKKSKKSRKEKKQATSPAKLIGTVLALVLAVGAIAFAVSRHTSRSDVAAAKPSQDSDPAPTPTSPVTPNPPKTGGRPVPVNPRPQPPKTVEPKESAASWEVWNPPKSQFGMRLPPGSEVEYQDGQLRVLDAVWGAGRVTDHRASLFNHKGRGFRIEVRVLLLKPGLSGTQREEVVLAEAKRVREERPRIKAVPEAEATLGGQPAKGEKYEVDDFVGFRRYAHTDKAVYCVEASGVGRLSTHWLKDVTTSVESLQFSPISSAAPPDRSANPFAAGSVSWLALPHAGTQIAAFGIVPVNPKDRSEGDKSQVQIWDRTKPAAEASPRDLVSPKLEFFTGPMAFSPDDKLLVVISHGVVIFFEAGTGRVQATGSLPGENREKPASVAFTPDGKEAVLVADGGIVTVRAADGQSQIRKPKGEGPDRRAVYLPSVNKVVTVRTAADRGGPEIVSWGLGSDTAPTSVPIVGIKSSLTAFGFSADGKRVAVCPDRGDQPAQVTIHDTTTGKVVTQMPVDTAANYRGYSDLKFSPDGQYLAGVGQGDVVRAHYASLDLFRVSNGQRLYHSGSTTAPRDVPFAAALTFTADSKSLYCVQELNKIVNIATEPSAKSN